MDAPSGKARVLVDAMGGDFAPQRIVEGAADAAEELGGRADIRLVGDRDAITGELQRLGRPTDRLDILHAAEAVTMGEHGASAVRRKRGSSLALAASAMRRGEADALVSAGNTAAVVSNALLGMGRAPGILRPAIATVLPTSTGHCVMLDAGATADCRPDYLVQFAVMGSVYAEIALHMTAPKIGLLNIGEEPGKGNELSRATHEALSKSGLRFVGNVEGRDVMRGTVDVVVSDGFVGNIVLKFGESMVEMLVGAIRKELKRDPIGKIGAALARPAFRRVFRTLDYVEYGGAPLLGVKGACIICHGSSTPRAVMNAVCVATQFVEKDLNGRIIQRLQEGKTHG